MGVDKGVTIFFLGTDWLRSWLKSDLLRGWARPWSQLLRLLTNWLLLLERREGIIWVFWNKSCCILSPWWNVRTLKNPESLLSCWIFDSIRLTVITDVRVLSNSWSIKCGFFSEDDFVFSRKCRSSSTITGVEALFFDDFSILFFNKLGATACRSNNAS